MLDICVCSSGIDKLVHPKNTLRRREVTPSGIEMVLRFLHILKESSPNDVNSSENVMSFKLVQPLNIPYGMLFIEFGIVTLESFSHLENMDVPMVASVSGRFTPLNFVHPINNPVLISVTESGMKTSVKVGQFKNKYYPTDVTLFPNLTVSMSIFQSVVNGWSLFGLRFSAMRLSESTSLSKS
jgi:hypothetical protein